MVTVQEEADLGLELRPPRVQLVLPRRRWGPGGWEPGLCQVTIPEVCTGT